MEINKIYCGDSVKLMKKIVDNTIDITVTSPPYDNLREYDGYSFDFENVAKELFRITKDGGVVVWVVGDTTTKGDESGVSFKQALYFKEIGFNLHDTMIWHKKAKFPHHENSRRYKPQFEYMFVFSKGMVEKYNPIYDVLNTSYGKEINIKCKIKTKNNGKFNGRTKNIVIKKFRMRDNVWTFSQQGFKGHPAPFPEKLAEDHILSWSNEGDLVLDPMCGSGTTCKMAKLNNRKFIGIDCSEEYCSIARERTTQFHGGAK